MTTSQVKGEGAKVQYEENALKDGIAILDFGSQYSQLIARRVRENSVYSELLPHSISAADLKKLNPRGIILSGGPNSCYDEHAPKLDAEIWKMGLPILGVCYGMQLMSHDLGGKVEAASIREYGRALLTVVHHGDLFDGLDPTMESWMSHGDSVVDLPEGFSIIACTADTPVAGIANEEKKFYGVQFHPEVVHTVGGKQVISNFTLKICGCPQKWTMSRFVEEACEVVRTHGKASTSFVQRHLQIGYNRAARLVERMEADGVISPANHAGKREVLGGRQ